MARVVKILVILVLCLSLTRGVTYPEFKFLRKLLDVIRKEEPIRTILIIKHSQDRNCSLQHWNPRGVPILRANEFSSIKVRGYFDDQSIALVCISDDSDSKLLEVLANAFDKMRQERIILWKQEEPKKELLEHITKQSIKWKFIRVILLANAKDPSGMLSFYRMNAFPNPQFTKIKVTSHFKNISFFDFEYTYHGATAVVKESKDSTVHYKLNTSTGNIFVSQVEDLEIIEFANKYNLTLRMYDENDSKTDHFDFQLHQRFITHDSPTQMDFINPGSATSLMVLVPCSRECGFVDVVKMFESQSWLLYLFYVYLAFVLIETFILWLTHRISGKGHRLTSLNPLLNLRAFRAILGLPFPEIRSSSISLRQLSLAISIFGFISSNFVSCKLSSLLTKPFLRSQVRNFEELRASGLITITDAYTRFFIESEIDPQFFNEVIPNYVILGKHERLRMLFHLNDSFSFIIPKRLWLTVDQFQKSVGEKVFCESKNLIIVEDIPRMYVLENNSIYRWMLTRFLIYIHESGIIPLLVAAQENFDDKDSRGEPISTSKNSPQPLQVIHG
ncbi:uncharacterized protein LOC108052970 [Drosophila rhopaloa]|uniref:Uncharacterized protein n=1 Tax=Drosophila rhopaloa TaxID=1041015 RepID=A0ABM5I6S1_DRORH|nr:uncharacterized protein LOC108052970 [Drosophila rhopaloa]